MKWDPGGFEMKYRCGKVAEVELELEFPTVSMEVAEELISILAIGELGEIDKMIGNAEWRKESTCPSTGGDKSAGLEHGGGIKLKAFRVPREGEKKGRP